MHPFRTSGAPVAYSSTGDISVTYRAGILCSRPWIRMYVARHQKEQELGTVGYVVVELMTSSAAAN